MGRDLRRPRRGTLRGHREPGVDHPRAQGEVRVLDAVHRQPGRGGREQGRRRHLLVRRPRGQDHRPVADQQLVRDGQEGRRRRAARRGLGPGGHAPQAGPRGRDRERPADLPRLPDHRGRHQPQGGRPDRRRGAQRDRVPLRQRLAGQGRRQGARRPQGRRHSRADLEEVLRGRRLGLTASMDWNLFGTSLWPIVRGALIGTIPLAFASFVLGLAIALVVALMRLSRSAAVSAVARAYVSVIRGTPLLVQLFVIFYGLPSVGLTIKPWPSALIAFSLNVGGYAAEVIRAAIQSVPKGQWEAAHMIGMSHRQALRRIILPQAARVSVPPLSNTFISLVKDTSLASLILVAELFRRSQEIAAFSQEFLALYVEAGLVYWVVCLALSAGQSVLENRLDRHVAH